jgi:hypothetical protein
MMEAFFSDVLVFKRPASHGDGNIAAANDDARRQSSDALSTSTTSSEFSDDSDDHESFSRASSVYIANRQGDDEHLPSRKTLRRDSKTLSRSTLVDFAKGCHEVHYFSESREAQIARRPRYQGPWTRPWYYDETIF